MHTRLSRSRYLPPLPLLAISLLLIPFGCKPNRMPAITLPVASASEELGDPCLGQAQCVTVYMAPWCPHCHASIPFINDLRKWAEENSHTGIRVIVGDDQPERLEEMAKEVGGTVFLDRDRKFKQTMRFNPVPTWWVTDSDGEIKKTFSGRPAIGDRSETGRRKAVARFAREYLQLS